MLNFGDILGKFAIADQELLGVYVCRKCKTRNNPGAKKCRKCGSIYLRPKTKETRVKK
ncbi:MAG: 50S ribosomal protein L40e [Candidatus Micrarchaeaceae archaeon]